jgi:hypothetical protein
VANAPAAEGSALERLAAAANVKRPVHRFKVPKESGEGTISSVGLVQLTITEEQQIGDAHAGKRTGLPLALAKATLVEVDGKAVTDANDSREIAWATMPPKVRSLVLMAYNKLHLPNDGDVDAFLLSEEVVVS